MTQEQFLQILPAYYGCQVDYQIGKAIFVAWIPGSSNRAHGTLYFTDGWANIAINQFKLILRSFDQITDEEYIQFIKVVNPQYNHHPSAYYYLQFRETGILSVTGKSVIGCTSQVNYLRSIGVDCDGIIEAGWAIKEGEQ